MREQRLHTFGSENMTSSSSMRRGMRRGFVSIFLLCPIWHCIWPLFVNVDADDSSSSSSSSSAASSVHQVRPSTLSGSSVPRTSSSQQDEPLDTRRQIDTSADSRSASSFPVNQTDESSILEIERIMSQLFISPRRSSGTGASTDSSDPSVQAQGNTLAVTNIFLRAQCDYLFVLLQIVPEFLTMLEDWNSLKTCSISAMLFWDDADSLLDSVDVSYLARLQIISMYANYIGMIFLCSSLYRVPIIWLLSLSRWCF